MALSIMTCDPHWTAYLSALSLPVIALMGAFIAFRQWRTSQNKLKFDLFDRRFAIFSAAQSFMLAFAGGSKIGDDALFRFLTDTHQARWLLNEPIADYLKQEIYNRAIEIQTLRSELEGVGVGEERTKNVRRQREVREELTARLSELDILFRPFLQLDP